MRLYIITLSIFLIILAGCNQQSENKIPTDNVGLLAEIEAIGEYDYHDSKKVEEIIAKYNHVIDMSRAMEDKKTELHCLVKLLEIQGNIEDYKEAIITGHIALDLAISINDTEAMANVYKLIAGNYYHLASFTQAFEYLENALQLYTDLNDTANLQDVLNIQGNVYYTYNDLEKAYSYYSKNLEISRLRNDKLRIAKALTNIGVIYSNLSYNEDISEDSVNVLNNLAIENIHNAYTIIKDTDESITKAEILYNLSDEYRRLGNYDEAIKLVKIAISLSENISERVYTWTSSALANILMEMDSVERAKDILHKVSEIAENNELHESMVNIEYLLSEIYLIEKDYENAFIHRDKYYEISESIYSIDQKNEIDAIKLASEIEVKKSQDKIKRQQWIYRLSVIFLILLSIIIFIFHLYTRLRQKSKNVELENSLLNERLEARNRELSMRIMALIQRNEVEKEMVVKLNKLKIKLKKENQAEVQDIVRSLSLKQSDQLWKEFEIRFESIHKEFFTRLAEAYPDLTTNERRLCAFLYLDMSSKDISAITGQSIRALNVARTRLRKRFNLTNDTQTISGFLNSL